MKTLLVLLVLCLIVFSGCTGVSNGGDITEESVEEETANLSNEIISVGEDLSGIIGGI